MGSATAVDSLAALCDEKPMGDFSILISSQERVKVGSKLLR